MVNQSIIAKARQGEAQIAMPHDFKQSLLQNGYIVWKLHDFEGYQLTDTPVMPDFANYVEKHNGDLHGALLRAHFDVGLWPVVYEGENNGHLIRHVCPLLTKADTISSQGGAHDFYPHVDNPDLRITGEAIKPRLGCCPDTLTLLCLRDEPGVNTSILLIDEVLKRLDVETITDLKRPEFQVRRPESFENTIVIKSLPVLVKHKGLYYSRFDWHNVSGMTKAAEHALEKLRHTTLNNELWHNVPLVPGTAVTFLNQRTLHTRNAFTPRYDGTDRWLLRVFGIFNKPLRTQLLTPESCEHNLRTV
ncbi:TauD/TfdA family dioxygenase [Serratia symbiotica]|uniref:TauD/TfdA-like domain-containing protein n=1 Tax=Serratia symbiotica TaxID=138074 RepID=A0A068Z7Z4_9GAMM|nr:TauD/TfdA family dioxygenase [Serratia symbiotica]QLH64515.1 hypothetical protein SYMBAF_16945 [Serratia symbiotica]CDS57050.1 conserved hypothetical protein [Serratia symbiotica]